MKQLSNVLLSFILSSASAFGPKPLIMPVTTVASIGSKGFGPTLNASLKMAAGGAERATQDEYYDGTAYE